MGVESGTELRARCPGVRNTSHYGINVRTGLSAKLKSPYICIKRFALDRTCIEQIIEISYLTELH